MKQEIVAQFTRLYGGAPDVVARAPGRIEFIGNHTDYNGGTTLGAAIDRSVWVAVRKTTAGRLHFATASQPGVVIVDTAELRKRDGSERWVNYPLGVWVSFNDFGLPQPAGFEFLCLSNLPVGAGLSSSAAIELASALAYLALVGADPPREVVVALCRQAENHFAGVPCGILDQGTSGFGKRNHFVFIDCREPRFELVPIPAGTHLWVFNTRSKHALIDGLYATRHRECADAAKALGVKLLADVTPAEVEEQSSRLSEIAYRRAKHVVDEIERVARVRAALAHGELGEVGRLLIASHGSSQRLFENSTAELDFLVKVLTTMPHVFGARLTGGGFGGAVMAFTGTEFSSDHAARVAEAFAGEFHSLPDVIHCETDDGAEVVVPEGRPHSTPQNA